MAHLLENGPASSRTIQSQSTSHSPPYSTYDQPAPNPSPVHMSPQSFHSFLSHVPESPLPSQEINSLPGSGWYNPSHSAPNYHSETSYVTYGQYAAPHLSPTNILPLPAASGYQEKRGLPNVHSEQLGATASPSSIHSAESAVPDSTGVSEDPQRDWSCVGRHSATHLRHRFHTERPQNCSNSLQRVPTETAWPTNALGIHSPHSPYYPAFTNVLRSHRFSEPLMELPSNDPTSSQSRRIYTPIAPLPTETLRSQTTKRSREEEHDISDETKRRKRSESTSSTQFELSEEDKLLLQLKDEESMPWKDIAARFQSDLGKTYQIPALQMRLKRLRERMRVWTDADIKALRMAHEYWVQSKFDIIAQKMLEFGALEKWTARQCARKWTMEIDPVPYAHMEHHVPQGFVPYTRSPAEPPSAYVPYLHVQ